VEEYTKKGRRDARGYEGTTKGEEGDTAPCSKSPGTTTLLRCFEGRLGGGRNAWNLPRPLI